MVLRSPPAVPGCHASGPLAGVRARAAGLDVAWLQEKIYGRPSARAAALGGSLVGPGAVSYIPCRPAAGGEIAGVQLWGVRGAVDVRPVPGGRLGRGPGWRMLHLSSVEGGRGPADDQARRMFDRAAAAARSHGFEYGDTVRTWIYVRRLLDWYDAFNAVRREFYARHRFASGAFPASTGIQAAFLSTECRMDALLVQGVPVTPIESTARQGRPSRYGSAFSRGMELAIDGDRTIHVSGTASIDGAGRSLHPGDAGAQCRETLRGVSAVLAERGAELRDIVSATVFCKTPAVRSSFRHALDGFGVPALPAIYVVGDVCRPELLVEMEAVACP
jgi:enamine deaminase RidA (YjgF/YER057c/UK114 family)